MCRNWCKTCGPTVLITFACFVFLGGCTAYTMPPASADHPAHPQAAAAPTRPLSQTLTARADDPPHDDMSMESEGAHTMEHDPAPVDAPTVVGTGIVVVLVPGTQQLVIDHEEIEGFMGAMTMGFRVRSPSLLDHVRSGDVVHFTIDTTDGAIIAIEKVTP